MPVQGVHFIFTFTFLNVWVNSEIQLNSRSRLSETVSLKTQIRDNTRINLLIVMAYGDMKAQTRSEGQYQDSPTHRVCEEEKLCGHTSREVL